MGVLGLTLIDRGGLMMWPLLILSVIGFVLTVERALYLHRRHIRTVDFVGGIKNLLEKRRLIEALTVCEDTPVPVSSMIKAALLHYDREEGEMRGAIQTAALVQIPLLERRIGTILAIARIAPLIGLLGTVLGMLRSFGSYLDNEATYANVRVLVEGFTQALITTATGLAIAVVAYIAYHFLHGRVRALVHDMEWVGNDIMQFLLRDFPEESSESEGEGESEGGSSV